MIKNKFIIAGVLGVTIGLGTVSTTVTIVKAETIQEAEHKPKTNVEAVQAVNDIIDPLIDAKNSNNIKEFKRLVNKFKRAVDTAESFGVDDLTMQDLRERQYHWQGYLDKKEAELANINKKSTPKEEVTKPKAPVTEKKETKPTKNKDKRNTDIKATEQQVEKQVKAKVEEPKKEVVKEEQITNTENETVVDKVVNEEHTSTENLTEIKENVKEDVAPTTPVKEETTSKYTAVNNIELESDDIESTLLAKVMVIVGAVLVIVGAVAAIKIKKKK